MVKTKIRNETPNFRLVKVLLYHLTEFQSTKDELAPLAALPT